MTTYSSPHDALHPSLVYISIPVSPVECIGSPHRAAPITIIIVPPFLSHLFGAVTWAPSVWVYGGVMTCLTQWGKEQGRETMGEWVHQACECGGSHRRQEGDHSLRSLCKWPTCSIQAAHWAMVTHYSIERTNGLVSGLQAGQAEVINSNLFLRLYHGHSEVPRKYPPHVIAQQTKTTS